MAKTRKRGADISPRICGAFVRACQILDEEAARGKTRNSRKVKGLTELMIENLEDNFVPTINALSKFQPKVTKVEGKVTHDHEHSVIDVQETLGRLHGMVEDATVERTETTPSKPLLN